MTEGTAPVVSVIITTRNRLTLLPRALQSVYAQGYPNLEILVLDDASQDGTSDYIRSHHPDIRLFGFHQNRGLITARNFLMREANGDYIVSLDDDAYFPHADTISKVAARMEGEPELAVVAFRVVGCKEDASGPTEPEHYTSSYWGCGHCIRKAVLRETGYYREIALRESEESDLSLRVLDKAYRLVYFPSATIVHNSLVSDPDLGRIRTLAARNRLLHAWLNEPFPWYILSTANALVSYTARAAWNGSLRNVLRGFYRAFMEFPRLRSGRQPVSSRAMRIYLTLGRQKIRDSSAIRALYLNPPSIFGILFRLGS
jgi:glycosyltransferase involved in cell wall biosynthesis